MTEDNLYKLESLQEIIWKIEEAQRYASKVKTYIVWNQWRCGTCRNEHRRTNGKCGYCFIHNYGYPFQWEGYRKTDPEYPSKTKKYEDE